MCEVILCLLRLNLWVAVCVETTCTTACSELQCRRSETQNASRPTPVTVHRKPGGKRFWPHRLPHTALEHPETVEIRAPKSKWNKLKSAENRYKRAEKVFPISLGSGDRAFEPHYSDQSPSEIVDFRGIFLILCLLRRKWWEFWELNLVVQLFDDTHPWVCYNQL